MLGTYPGRAVPVEAYGEVMERSPDVETRVERFTRGSDLGWVADTLAERRDEILDHWLEATTAQPFHQGRREHAVADHVPHLFDALVDLLQRSAPRSVDPGAPLDDSAVLLAAREHARVRMTQGLQPADIVVEFRLLRQETVGALRFHLADDTPTSDIIGAALLVNDALDGAISLALEALTRSIEEAREDFFATTVHEVRQPITAIKGSLQLAVRELGRPAPDVERASEALQRADAATNRMVRVLTTLTDVSRLTLGRLDLQPTTVDLIEMIRVVIGRLDSEDESRVALNAPSDLDATGQWDAAALDQVMGNLLSNAVKYSATDTPIEVAVQAHTETVELRVRDHGIGLTEEEITRLFQRYSRGQGANAHGIAGLGLGLYLSRGIAEAHGGRIWAESDGPGRGTTMRLILPRRVPSAPAEP